MKDRHDRGESVQLVCEMGGSLMVGLDGPPGEALHVNVGIENMGTPGRVVLMRKFTADEAEDIANEILIAVSHLRTRT